ncbi:MAG: hypothetical protein HOV87_12105 [Catenulispora sp.]|nr:hypothetical protein [Catenulispora sp.]NUT40007.1 hypothetical protein [Thermoactinospora sp.]
MAYPFITAAADTAANGADWTSAGASVVGVIVAVLLLVVTWRQVTLFRQQNALAEQQIDIAGRQATMDERLAVIEETRLHDALRPQLQITVTEQQGDRARLHIKLVGPPALDGLDAITVSVGNDDADHEGAGGQSAPGINGPTEQEIRDQVWGPYRFGDSADGVDAHGRTVAPFRLALGYGRPLGLRRTLAPRWANHESWFSEYDGQPVRLLILCELDGYKPWRVVWEGVPTPAQ